MHFRHNKKARTEPTFQELIMECVSDLVLPLARVRKFARKAAAMRKIYKRYQDKHETNDYAIVQKLYNECKAHRSAIDQFYKFICEA
jgi:hypothetical protein